ncbi:hypothetical protein LLG38_08725 [bacterium]|nr:hypothetical protein [bacterium]
MKTRFAFAFALILTLIVLASAYQLSIMDNILYQLPRGDTDAYIGLAQSFRQGNFGYPPVPDGYQHYYRSIAKNMSFHYELRHSWSTVFPPGYPLLVALCPGETCLENAVIVSIVMLVVGLVALYVLCARYAGETGAYLAVLCVAFAVPIGLATHGYNLGKYLIAPGSDTACYGLILLAFALDSPAPKGLAMGLAALCRPEALLIGFIHGLLLKTTRAKIIMLAIMVATCLPYAIFCRANVGYWCLTDKQVINESIAPYKLAGFNAIRDCCLAFGWKGGHFPSPLSREGRRAFQKDSRWHDAVIYMSKFNRVEKNLAIMRSEIAHYWPYLLGVLVVPYGLWKRQPLARLALPLVMISPLWMLYFYDGERFLFPLLFASAFGYAELTYIIATLRPASCKSRRSTSPLSQS